MLTGYSSPSSLPRVGLCLSGLVIFAGINLEGLGEPTRSRAISRTILLAEKFLFLRFFGIERSRLDAGLCIFAHSLGKSAIIKTVQFGL
jgi:hypothetical protein